MKIIFPLISLLFLVVTAFAQQLASLPAVQLQTITGESVSTNEITNDGSPILIIVWATWCHHATDGMTSINDEFLDDWIEKYNLKVVGISVDDARNTVKVGPIVNGNGWDFEHFMDPNGDFKRAMGVNAPPHLFIINGKREVVWSFNSFNPGDETEIEKILESIKTE
ncbi:MAG: hypothetical protein CL840_17305 [Crocinitomicaceae bacterium]|nr:hypothetical protein [Crocinitomicaceae bacterium]|tara:strand:+ start:568 stop:1068 length:501 start_codon:yes stop_codon:yes gene_type:complete